MSSPSTGATSATADDTLSLIRKIQELRHSGLNTSLPPICIIGEHNHNAVKGSLIEGISEIKLPDNSQRGPGCPVEISLLKSDQAWTCKIYLSRKYRFDLSLPESPLQSKRSPFGPWVEQNIQDELFTTLHDKNETLKAIMWAQAALLNPGWSSRDYVLERGEGVASWQEKFSPNIVRLDISGPGLPTLSLYDLPSVIATPDVSEGKSLVTPVRNLIKKYISNKTCIVLLVSAMTDDGLKNGAARILGILERVQGAMERTLGVFTTPHHNEGEEVYARRIETLTGKKLSLGHGFFVFCNRSSHAPSHSRASAAGDAAVPTSFLPTGPANDQSRPGIHRLQDALSNLLRSQVQRCQSAIAEQSNKEAARIEGELKVVRELSPAREQLMLYRSIHEFNSKIRTHIDAASSPLQETWFRTALDFRQALAHTRPAVQLSEDLESDCEMVPVPHTLKRSASVRPHSRRNRRVPISPELQPRPQKTNSFGYLSDYFTPFHSPARTLEWRKIREMNACSYHVGMPDQPDLGAVEAMWRSSVQHWNSPMETFLDVTHRLVRKTLAIELKKVFGDYQQTKLYRECERIIHGYLSVLEDTITQQSQEIYQSEYDKPFTMALGELERESKKWEEILSRSETSLTADPAPEVKTMAATYGYYEVASAHFVHMICRTVHMKLFRPCKQQLIRVIEEGLDIVGENASQRCQELLTEDPEREHRRHHLLSQKAEVDEVRRRLSTIEHKDEVRKGPLIYRL